MNYGASVKRGLMAMILAAGVAGAAEDAAVKELERKIDALSVEIERLKLHDVAIAPSESVHGMGPAASKVYRKESGVSLGGYGEALYQNFESSTKNDQWDLLRFVLYAGYKYNDRVVLNTELEVEHATTEKEGDVGVEFAYIDYLFTESFNLRGGLVLVPMGLINEFHEPTTFLSARRPDVENKVIPSTWREGGIGAFGDVAGFSYKAYLLNGLKGEDFSASGIRSGRQKGSEASAESFAGVARVDYTAINDLLIGGSFYYGDAAQDLPFSVNATMADLHFDWKWNGLSLRAVGVIAEIDGAGDLSAYKAEKEEVALADFDPVGERMTGWYVEAGYDLFAALRPGSEASLTPFVRFESYNTQDKVPSGFEASGKNDVDVTTVGLNFKPIAEVVLKADYQFYDDAANKLKNQWNLGLGYIF